MLSYLGVEELLFSSHSELREFERQVSGLPIEIKIKAELKVNPPNQCDANRPCSRVIAMRPARCLEAATRGSQQDSGVAGAEPQPRLLARAKRG